MSERTALPLHPWLAELDETQTNTMAVFLLSELANATSLWSPYLRSLPKVSPAAWVDQHLSEFQSQTVETFFKRRRGAAVDKHRRLFDEFLFLEDPVAFNRNDFSLEKWVWALSMLFSRTFAVYHEDLEGKLPSLVPLGDMLNTARPHNVESRTEGTTFVFRAVRDVAAGEQLFGEYGSGEETPAEILLDYGFVVPANVSALPSPWDHAELLLPLPAASDPAQAKKHLTFQALKFIGSDGRVRVPVYGGAVGSRKNGGISKELLAAARVSEATSEELDSIRTSTRDLFTKPITAANELKALHLIESMCTSQLEAYPTDIDADFSRLVENKENAHDLSLAPVHFRFAEKRLLETVRLQARTLAAQLQKAIEEKLKKDMENRQDEL